MYKTDEMKKSTTVDTFASGAASIENGTAENFGYVQSYRRVLKTLGNVCLVISLTAPLPAIMVAAFYQVSYGGFFGLSWGWIIPSLLYFPQTLAVAELCSAMPVNGGFYWWAAALAPARYARFFGFVTGWLSVASLTTTLASFSYATASSLAFSISITIPSWTPTPAQTMGMAMGVIAVWALLMLFRLENINVVIIVIAGSFMLQFLIFTIALPASHAAQGRPFNSAETVFATYTNYSDWAPGVAIPMTWFCAIWTNSAWVAPAYMAEETQDASKAAPKAIIESYVVTALMGTFICLLFAFCISDMDLIAADTTGFPLLQVIIEHWGVRYSSIFLLTFSPLGIIGGGGMLLTYASQVAAFARDGCLPFSSYLARVHQSTSIPLNAVIFQVALTMLFLLFSLSEEASHVIYSMAVVAAVVTWAIPVALRIFASDRWIPGKFNFGRWSMPIHIFTLLSQIYILIMESFPPYAAFDGLTFNYAWVLTVIVGLLAAIFFATFDKRLTHIHFKNLNRWRSERVGADL